jgi:hypothetical protein
VWHNAEKKTGNLMAKENKYKLEKQTPVKKIA